MRPTITEALVGIRRVLEHDISPDLRSDHARVTLSHALIALQQVELHWARLLPDLLADDDELIELLGKAAAVEALPDDLRDRVRAELGTADGRGVSTDVAAVDAGWTDRRRLLAEIITAAAAAPGPETDALRAAIRLHLRASVDRHT